MRSLPRKISLLFLALLVFCGPLLHSLCHLRTGGDSSPVSKAVVYGPVVADAHSHSGNSALLSHAVCPVCSGLLNLFAPPEESVLPGHTAAPAVFAASGLSVPCVPEMSHPARAPPSAA